MKFGKIIKTGIGTLGLVGVISTINQGYELKKEKDAVSNLNAVVRYYEIENELNKPISAKQLFDQNALDKYSRFKAEQDSLDSSEGFYDSKQKYDSINKKKETTLKVYLGSGIIASIFGGLAFVDLLGYLRKRKQIGEQ